MKFSRFRVKLKELGSIIRHEYKYIFSDSGVMLLLIGAIFIYTIIYSLAYKNEVLRDIPFGIVDNSHTSSSRQLVRALDASPNIDVKYNPASLDEARSLFMDRKINGVVVIPSDYEKKLMSNQTVNVAVYVDASYFLMYRQALTDITAGILTTDAEVEWVRFVSQGIMPKQAEAISNPVLPVLNNMYNPYGGYATFLLPAIIMVIIQQTLLIGIGMVGGTWREHRLYGKLVPYGEKRLAVLPIVTGKTLVYLSIYTVTLLYILGVHYKLFGYPANGHFLTIGAFLLPYMLSCIFLGIALASVFKTRENSLLVLLFSSIPCLMLSGASVPKESLPQWLYTLGLILPSSTGVDGFLRVQVMGATLGEVSSHILRLWGLTVIYFILACVGTRRTVIASEKESQRL